MGCGSLLLSDTEGRDQGAHPDSGGAQIIYFINFQAGINFAGAG